MDEYNSIRLSAGKADCGLALSLIPVQAGFF
jgi:hypothetical protein